MRSSPKIDTSGSNAPSDRGPCHQQSPAGSSSLGGLTQSELVFRRFGMFSDSCTGSAVRAANGGSRPAACSAVGLADDGAHGAQAEIGVVDDADVIRYGLSLDMKVADIGNPRTHGNEIRSEKHSRRPRRFRCRRGTDYRPISNQIDAPRSRSMQ